MNVLYVVFVVKNRAAMHCAC